MSQLFWEDYLRWYRFSFVSSSAFNVFCVLLSLVYNYIFCCSVKIISLCFFVVVVNYFYDEKNKNLIKWNERKILVTVVWVHHKMPWLHITKLWTKILYLYIIERELSFTWGMPIDINTSDHLYYFQLGIVCRDLPLYIFCNIITIQNFNISRTKQKHINLQPSYPNMLLLHRF